MVFGGRTDKKCWKAPAEKGRHLRLQIKGSLVLVKSVFAGGFAPLLRHSHEAPEAIPSPGSFWGKEKGRILVPRRHTKPGGPRRRKGPTGVGGRASLARN